MCTPNALSTLMEFVVDHASRETYEACHRLIREELDKMPEGPRKRELMDRLRRIEETEERDLYF
jgi:2-iminoacetate synthase